MKIKVNKWIVKEQDKDYYYSISYKIDSIKRCCDNLINSKNICINNELVEHDTYWNDNIEYMVKLKREEDLGWDYGTETFYETIQYCPFCGEKINIEIIDAIDKTEEFKTLEKERKELWKKLCSTDSKKKEYILQKQVTELDRKINNILTSDDFNKKENL